MKTKKICPYCQKTIERCIEGNCPHCNQFIARGTRRCPACSHVFTRSVVKNTTGNKRRRYCPECGIEIYYATGGKVSNQTILAIDKNTCATIVKMVELFISDKTNTVFAFEPKSEFPKELVLAYSLLDRSKTFFRKQPDDYGMNPHQFTIDLVEYVLSKWRGDFMSIAMMIPSISGNAAELFRQKKLNAKINRAGQYGLVDYEVFSVEWN